MEKEIDMVRTINRVLATLLYMHLAFGGFLNAKPIICNLNTPNEHYALGVLSLIALIAIVVEMAIDAPQ